MLTQERFDEWRSSPLTKEFFKFLSDKREDAKETWARGQEMSKEVTATAFVYGEILTLEYTDVAEFYGIELEEKENTDEPND